MIKNFVVDTNILLHSPNAITNGFADNNVIITGTTLQELDKKKTFSGEIGYNARRSIRILDELRKTGDLTKGVPINNGGHLFVETKVIGKAFLPEGYDFSVPDNRILSTCLYLNTCNKNVILVTNDISMRVNASILGIAVEEYKNDQIEPVYLNLSDCVHSSMIDEIYEKGFIECHEDFFANQFVMLVNDNEYNKKSALTVYQDGFFKLIDKQKTFGHIKPLNAMQTYAIWALRQPAEEIPLVILLGPAGTAKTLLSLAVGMEFTYTDDARYNKILLSRPNGIGFSNIGFLPGDLEQKLSPLMASFYDNMEVILGFEDEEREQIRIQMEDILETGIVELCSLDFIRGRSLQNTYIICDEAQNASKGLIRDVVTRAGRGSKVVLAGDPEQIDVSSLDKYNNGLVFAASTMADSPYSAIVTFDQSQSVRSDLAKEAIRRMTFKETDF